MSLDLELRGALERPRRAPRDDRRGGGARGAADPVRDDAGDRAQLGAQGYDPRDFVLVAAGGAGPLFACDIARELEIPRVLVPPHPGIIAATGLLATDLQHEFVATERHALADGRLPSVWSAATRARSTQARRSSTPTACRGSDACSPARRLPLRRPGLRGALRRPRRARSTTTGCGELAERFHRAHEREYGHRFERRDRDHQHPRHRRRHGSPSWSWPRASAHGTSRRVRSLSSATWCSSIGGRRRASHDRSTTARCCGPANGSRGRR